MSRFDKPKRRFAEYVPPPPVVSKHIYELAYTNRHGIRVTMRYYTDLAAQAALVFAKGIDANAQLKSVR